jgi:formyl-CoA transferase
MTTDNVFSGLKVVDLASFIAGPGAAVILSDFGADVIKVEPPSGDMWRIGYKIPPQPRALENYPWHLSNRNKRGLAVDLKSPRAGEVLEKLVKWADVLIVNTPHPARKRLHLEYDDVVKWNPRLIYADLTGYGTTGPRRPAGLRLSRPTGPAADSLALTGMPGAALPVAGGGITPRRWVSTPRSSPASTARAHRPGVLRHHFAPAKACGRAGAVRPRCAGDVLPSTIG